MKSFTKKATVIALSAIFAAPGVASAEAKLFGKAHLSFGSVSEDTGATDTSSNAVTSHASRVGVKGDIDTGNGTSVIYRFAWQVDMSDVSKEGADVNLDDTDGDGFVDDVEVKSKNHIKSREQYVGLKGDWGQVRIGRDDSPYKKAGKKNVEHLSDTWADFNNIIDKGQDTRHDDSIGYWGKVGPGAVGIMYAAGDDSVSGENAGESLSIAYDMKMGAIGFAIAHQSIEIDPTNDETGLKLSFGYKMGDTKLGLMYENVEDDATLDDKNTYFSVKHAVSKEGSIVFAYGVKDQGLADDATMTALSYMHKMDKKVTVYGLYADGADNGLDAASKLEGDGSALVVGLVAKF